MGVLIFIGALAGLVMGAVGVGGGAVIILCLMTLAKFPQKVAQGTTLLIVAAPISLLAAMRYYKQGHVDVKAGLTVMVAFLIFSLIGAELGVHLPNHALKVMLGIMLVLMGVKLIVS